MKNVLVIVVAAIVLFSGALFTEGKEKKKKVTSAPSSTVKSEPAAPAAPAIPATSPGWTDVKTNSPNIVKVSYKIEGREIIVNFKNLSKNSPIRIKYTVKWKKNHNGKWVDDATMEGISFRLKQLEWLTREIRTGAQEFKDVVIDLDVSESS